MTHVLHKRVAWTPLEAIDALRAMRPQLAAAKLGYAGRLDPMAEGVLLVLEADENARSEPFRALEKEYRVRVLFGIATDSFDALGVITNVNVDALDALRIEPALGAFRGAHAQSYPPFSARTVDGRRLYAWARDGKRPPSVPAPIRTIEQLELEQIDAIAPRTLEAFVLARVRAVRGDFRQALVERGWRDTLANIGGPLRTAWLRVRCSSGTYMRSLAHDLGARLGVPALALEIVRTRVGPYELRDALRLA